MKTTKEERYESLKLMFETIDERGGNWFRRIKYKIYFLLRDLSMGEKG